MSDTTILQNNTHVIKPKKSVALSGVAAGNTECIKIPIHHFSNGT